MKLDVGRAVWELAERPRLFGVLNVTPDSFSDGGQFVDLGAAVAQGLRLAREGADALDVGGESTRPSGSTYGAGPREVSVDEELGRIVPVVTELRRRLPDLPISIDTRKAAVAEAALDAGADVVNDVSGGAFDPALLPLCARRGCAVVLMHSRGTPETMAGLASYGDVASEVAGELRSRLEAARAAGVARERIVLDPGLGFAKSPAQSRRLLRELNDVVSLGQPVLVGTSRKSFLGAEGPPGERLFESVGAALFAVLRGAALLRVHDVGPTARALRTVWAVLREEG
ncbi:MAG: dihydropteroate synthase [Deltaproteobacteria bacterium]